ncbi:unnamed protein product, partial [Protopolystoma xenopodis]
LCRNDSRINELENAAPKCNILHYGSSGPTENDGTLHSVSEEEQAAFSSWLERMTKNVNVIFHFLKMAKIYMRNAKMDYCFGELLILFKIFCQNYVKIINCSAPGTIDMRAVNNCSKLTTFQINENINLALNSARAIGCNVILQAR